MVTILIWLALALIAVCLLMMVGFGLLHAGRFAGEGKFSSLTFLLLVAVGVIAYVVQGSVAGAAILTAILMACLGILLLLFSGLQGLFR